MKKVFMMVIALCSFIATLHAQVEYKQNFLLAFSKQPDIKDCESAYSFLCCKDDICRSFNTTKADLAKAHEELTALQLAANSAVMPSSGPAMTAEEGKNLAEKLKKMTKEEKKQWAMQNAKSFMPSAAMHGNRDMDNQPVNEAVQCVTDQQRVEINNFNAMAEVGRQFNIIENTYAPKREEALKKFKTVTKSEYNPSSPFPYSMGEASDSQIAQFDKAVEEYRKTVLPLIKSEMMEKIKYILETEKGLVTTYTTSETKIALTNYADDAQEPSNKMHLLMGHMNVLQKVKTMIGSFESILSEYADQYSALMKLKSVKEVTQKGN
jgi:hypothetical protein